MIEIPVSLGELVDKITILQIKLLEIEDKEKLKNVKKEFDTLSELPIYKELKPQLNSFLNRLFIVNQKLWILEDDIRKCEKEQKFDSFFIECARNIYKTNDERSYIKKELNLKFNSELVEEKSYEE
jgi:hypothetical protein